MAPQRVTLPLRMALGAVVSACGLVIVGGGIVGAQDPNPPRCFTRFDNGVAHVICDPQHGWGHQGWRPASPPVAVGTAPPPAPSAPAGPAAGPTGGGSGGGVRSLNRPTAAPTITRAAPPPPVGAGAGAAAGGALRPVRALIEPAEMPPREVAGYGIVAFTTRPLPEDVARYTAICEAYKAVLMAQDELPANTPLSEQMVTYWPVLDKNTPEARRGDCAHLVSTYALRLGFDAIEDADKRHEGLARRRGPFLIAWAPSNSRSQPDAVVLVMDLSTLDDQRSFLEVLQDWRQQITDKPELWRRGFNIEALRRTIRDTFDRYGDGLLRLIKAG